jgi:hypothetical protein
MHNVLLHSANVKEGESTSVRLSKNRIHPEHLDSTWCSCGVCLEIQTVQRRTVASHPFIGQF